MDLVTNLRQFKLLKNFSVQLSLLQLRSLPDETKYKVASSINVERPPRAQL